MHAYSGGMVGRNPIVTVLIVLSTLVAINLSQLAEMVPIHVPPWLVGVPTAAGVFSVLWLILDRWAWRWKLFRILPWTETPVVVGAYEGTLISTYDEAAPLKVRIEISQTWSLLLVRLIVLGNTTSDSNSIAASLSPEGPAAGRLIYTYRNQVRPGVSQFDMNDHEGTANLRIDLQTGVAEGRYFNSRERSGTLSLMKAD